MHTRRSTPPVAAASLLLLAMCTDVGDIAGPPEPGVLPATALAAAPTLFCGVETMVTLLADETVAAGQVTIVNDESSIYVTYRTDPAWPIGMTAVFVGADAADVPTSGGGNPQIGRFPYKARHRDRPHEVTWRIPLDEVGSETAVIAAFAELGDDAEGAWGAGSQINPSAGWATYSTHTVQECAGASIDENGGTIVSNLGNVQLVVRPGALPGEEDISFEPATSSSQLAIEGTIFDFGPDDLEFDVPANLTIAFDPAALPNGVDPEQLRPFVEDGEFQIIHDFVLDEVANTITFSVEHFSIYGLLYADLVDLEIAHFEYTPAPARVGDDIAIDLEVRHPGSPSDQIVSDVDVAITLIDAIGVFRQSLSPNCDEFGEIVADGVRFNCSTGPLGPGGVAPFQLVLRAFGDAANETFSVRAEVLPASESVGDPSLSNNIDEIQVPVLPQVAADLRTSATGSSPPNSAKAGQPVLLHGTIQSKPESVDPVHASIRFEVDAGTVGLRVAAADLPLGCTFVATEITSTIITCAVGLLAPGGSAQRSVPVTPLQDRLYQTAVTALPLADDPTPLDNEQSISFVAEPTLLDLAVVDIDHSVDEIDAGQDLVFSARVQNLVTSPEALFAGTLRIEVAGEAEFVSATAGCEDVSEFVAGRSVAVNCLLSMLDPGETTDFFHLVLRATQPDQTLTGEARLLLADYVDDQDLANNGASITTRVRAENEVNFTLLELTESVDPAKPLNPLTYSATVQLGAASAGSTTGGEYRLRIIGDVAITSTPSASCSSTALFPQGYDVVCPLGPMSSHTQQNFDITVEPQNAPQQLDVTATIVPPASATEIAPGDETATESTDVIPLDADLWVSVIGDSPDPVTAGEIVTYEFFANSSGPDDVPRAVVQFRVTGEAELVSLPTNAIGVTCTDLSSVPQFAVVVNCDVEPLRHGIASPRLVFEVRAIGGSSLLAEAEVTPISATTVDPDLTDNLQSETTTVESPSGPPAVYVVNQRSNTVSVVDPGTNLVTATIPVTTNPFGAALTPDGSELWVLHASNQIDVIATATNTLVATFGVATSGRAFDIAFTPDGGKAVLTGNGGAGIQSIAIVDVASRTLITDITTGVAEFPRFVDILPDGSTAYVGASQAVMVIDLTTNTLASTIPVAGEVFDVVAASDGSAVYFVQQPSSGANLLRKVDPSTDAIAGAGIALGNDPLGVVLNAAGTEAYVSDEANSVYFVDLLAGTSMFISTGVGTHPFYLDITSDDASLFVVLRDADGIAEIDVATRSILATTTVGDTPAGVVVKN